MPGTARPATSELFFEQTMNQIRRHMTFYNIALHCRGVARIELLGHVVLDLNIDEFLTADVLLINFKAIRLQVPDPR